MPLHTRERDSQRSKVYAAEQAAFDLGRRQADAPAAFGRHDLSLAESQAFVDKVLGSAWFAKTFETSSRRDPFIKVIGGSRNGGALSFGSMYGGEIQVSPAGRREWILLHEIAHNIRTGRDPYSASHGWAWAATYVKLVQHHLGAEAAKALKAEFRSRKVRFTEPRPKRKLSPEQAETARRNLAAIRERKAAEKAAAEAADPLKVKVERKGNFSIRHTFGVKVEIVDRFSGDMLWATGTEGSGMMPAGDARDFGTKKATEFARALPGHEIAVHITGRGKGWHGTWHDDKAEVVTVRFEELAEAAG